MDKIYMYSTRFMGYTFLLTALLPWITLIDTVNKTVNNVPFTHLLILLGLSICNILIGESLSGEGKEKEEIDLKVYARELAILTNTVLIIEALVFYFVLVNLIKDNAPLHNIVTVAGVYVIAMVALYISVKDEQERKQQELEQ